jgi:hypothetical protein
MKSKVPKLFGSQFHAMVSEKFTPVLNELFSLCMEMAALHKNSDDPQQIATPLSSNAHHSLSVGISPHL